MVQPSLSMENVTTTLSATEKHNTLFFSNLSEDTSSVMDSTSSDGFTMKLFTSLTELIPNFSILLQTKTDQFSKVSSTVTTKGSIHWNLWFQYVIIHLYSSKVLSNLLFYVVYFSGKQTEGNNGNISNKPSYENVAGCLVALLSLAGSMSFTVQSMMI